MHRPQMSEGDSRQRRVLLLMPTSTYHAHDFLEAAALLGLDVTVGTNGTQALQELVPGSALTLDFSDVRASSAAIVDFAGEFPIDGVVAAEDETTALAATCAAALGIAHNPIEAILTTQSKVSLRAALAAAGLPSPGFAAIDLRGAGLPPQLSFPCVLKPTFLAASRGVIRADTATEFDTAAQRIARILDDPKLQRAGGDEADRILVEEYIRGSEYAVEAMLGGGRVHLLALFDKPDPLEGPYFEETIYVTPSRAAAPTQVKILQTVQQAVDAIGLCEGPLHAELRVNDSGAYIIDLAARSIGGLCPRVLRFGTGSSLEELILRHALGEDFSSFAREDRAAGVMMIPIPAAGTLREVRGLEEATAVPGIREVTITINRGRELVPLPEGNRYLGFIFASAEAPEEAEEILRRAHQKLHFDISAMQER